MSSKASTKTQETGQNRELATRLWDDGEVGSAKDKWSYLYQLLSNNQYADIFLSALYDSLASSDFIMLKGGVVTDANPNYSIVSGFGFQNGEMFEIVSSAATIGGGEVPVLVLDGSSNGYLRTVEIDNGTSGSGLVDVSDIIRLDESFQIDATQLRADNITGLDGASPPNFPDDIDVPLKTFTPRFRGTGGTEGSYSANAYGIYQDFGGMIYCQGSIELLNLGSWSGNMRIDAFPFNHKNDTNVASVGTVSVDGADFNAVYLVIEFSSTANTTAQITEVRDNASQSQMGISNFSVGDKINFTLIYPKS